MGHAAGSPWERPLWGQATFLMRLAPGCVAGPTHRQTRSAQIDVQLGMRKAYGWEGGPVMGLGREPLSQGSGSDPGLKLPRGAVPWKVTETPLPVTVPGVFYAFFSF